METLGPSISTALCSRISVLIKILPPFLTEEISLFKYLIYGGTVCQEIFGAKIRQNSTVQKTLGATFSDTPVQVFDNQALDASAHDEISM